MSYINHDILILVRTEHFIYIQAKEGIRADGHKRPYIYVIESGRFDIS
jgi:hypothetical protein